MQITSKRVISIWKDKHLFFFNRWGQKSTKLWSVYLEKMWAFLLQLLHIIGVMASSPNCRLPQAPTGQLSVQGSWQVYTPIGFCNETERLQCAPFMQIHHCTCRESGKMFVFASCMWLYSASESFDTCVCVCARNLFFPNPRFWP